MSRFIRNVLSVIFSFFRFYLLKLFYGDDFVFNGIQRFSPRTQLYFDKGGSIVLGSRVRAHTGTKLRAVDGGKIEIGKNTTLNYNCMVVALESIKIGTGVEFGPNVLIYDHDHDYRIDLKKGGYLRSPVSIGSRTWIGANTVILRGTIIGSNCIVGAGSVLSGNYPDNSIIVQKRKTTVKSY